MNKKKIIKIVSAILGVVVFIFICNQMGEILDNRRVRLEVEKDRAERQEKKEAGTMTEFLDSLEVKIIMIITEEKQLIYYL